MSTRPQPRAEYEARLADRREIARALEARSSSLSNIRVGVFLCLAAAAAVGFWVDSVLFWLTLVPVAAFFVLVVVHDRVIRARDRAKAAVGYYSRGLRRLDDDWEEDGVTDDDFVDPHHPYARDLNLFGRGSLFQLLCRARTRAGEERLATWLTDPSEVSKVRARQKSVQALRARLDLREDLALLGGEVKVGIRPSALYAWGEAPAVFSPRRAALLRGLALCLPTVAVVGAVLWAVTELGALPFLASGVVIYAVSRPFRDEVERAALSVEEPGRELALLSKLFARMETEKFEDPSLAALRDELAGASVEIARLERLAAWLEARQNQVFAPIAFFLMWSAHYSLAIERWRARSGRSIRGWMDGLAELEALSSLAGYAYEHPDDPLPDLVDGEPQLVGQQLGHPLLADASFSRNSVRLEGPLQVMIVSGSNMSGKSTLLRTTGINVVLALAGAPVRAESMKLTPLCIGATLRVEDSLREGASRFYAEVSRLRELSDMAARRPALFFLLDEVFHGTNSHDRLIGAEAVIRAFVDAGAIGLVTTHDLALARAADGLGERAVNVHFADEIVDGKLHFDYQMQPGVVQKSNALELMRSVGLSV